MQYEINGLNSVLSPLSVHPPTHQQVDYVEPLAGLGNGLERVGKELEWNRLPRLPLPAHQRSDINGSVFGRGGQGTQSNTFNLDPW